jgi:hypothetical protein
VPLWGRLEHGKEPLHWLKVTTMLPWRHDGESVCRMGSSSEGET